MIRRTGTIRQITVGNKDISGKSAAIFAAPVRNHVAHANCATTRLRLGCDTQPARTGRSRPEREARLPDEDIAAPTKQASRPRIAILRERVNGQVEMAALDRAGFGRSMCT
jgi:hypothetical protein